MGSRVSGLFYNGSDDRTNVVGGRFFSESFEFSSMYGEVLQYDLDLRNVFDICDRDDCERLIAWSRYVEDPYDGMVYRSYDEIDSAGILGMNTWELSENHVDVVKRLGYDGMVLYEDGIYNLMVFDPTSYVVVN